MKLFIVNLPHPLSTTPSRGRRRRSTLHHHNVTSSVDLYICSPSYTDNSSTLNILDSDLDQPVSENHFCRCWFNCLFLFVIHLFTCVTESLNQVINKHLLPHQHNITCLHFGCVWFILEFLFILLILMEKFLVVRGFSSNTLIFR